MDLFLRKPFWFFLIRFSILGSMRLRRRALYILAAIDVRVISRKYLANSRSNFLGEGRVHPFVHLFIGFWLSTALQCWSSLSSYCLVFHTSGGILSSSVAFLFLIFLSTESSSSWVNGPSLMPCCLLVILVIDSYVTFGGFLCKFSKCCFHGCICSCWLSLAFAVLFLLLTSFTVCYPRLYIFSWVSNLIDLILYIFFPFFLAYLG